MRQVYLDFTATTPTSREVFQAMKPYFCQKYGNPSEPHLLGQEARLAVEEAREKVAQFLGARAEEIIFTGSATESINLAHKGLIEAVLADFGNTEKPHIITSSVEHKAVLETCRHLERLRMAKVTYLPVDQYGLVKVENIEQAIKENTVLVSIMYVNNEVGTIEPIKEIGDLIKRINHKRLTTNYKPIYFHTDATQAIGYLNCKISYLGVDLLSFSGHKIYGPKGIGVLYVRSSTPLVRQVDGGDQEGGLRAGTENVAFIVGLGRAIELVKIQNSKCKVQNLKDKLIEGVLKVPGTKLTGHPRIRTPHIASFIVEGVEGEAMVLRLSSQGVTAATGSACASKSLQASHVLLAMGISPELAHGSLRFSFGKDTTMKDINYVTSILPKVIQDLRRMAPKF